MLSILFLFQYICMYINVCMHACQYAYTQKEENMYTFVWHAFMLLNFTWIIWYVWPLTPLLEHQLHSFFFVVVVTTTTYGFYWYIPSINMHACMHTAQLAATYSKIHCKAYHHVHYIIFLKVLPFNHDLAFISRFFFVLNKN